MPPGGDSTVLFYSLFLTHYLLYSAHIPQYYFCGIPKPPSHIPVAIAPANADVEDDEIAWEVIPGYFLLVKLFTCLLRQFYKEKLKSFTNTALLKLYGRSSLASSMSSPTRSASVSSNSTPESTGLWFRAETPKSFTAITQAAKDLLENPYLLSVWAHVCMSYTNTIQSRSVELSLNQLNGWTQVRFY